MNTSDISTALHALSASIDKLSIQLLAMQSAHSGSNPLIAPDVRGATLAWRYRRSSAEHAWFAPVRATASIQLDDLQHIDAQKQAIVRNTLHFVEGRPANNVLLTGARGTGKSSLVRACLHAFAAQGLRLIEVDKDDLRDLIDIVDTLANLPAYFIIYCDDLSFEAGEAGYKALKTVLDGSIAATAPNVLVYASSNRRHLMPEFMSENLERTRGAEIHPGEAVEEKIALSERFGLWLSFYPFDQEEYLRIVTHWLEHLGVNANDIAAARQSALNWAAARGSRSARVAWHFARHWAAQCAADPTMTTHERAQHRTIADVQGLGEAAGLS